MRFEYLFHFGQFFFHLADSFLHFFVEICDLFLILQLLFGLFLVEIRKLVFAGAQVILQLRNILFVGLVIRARDEKLPRFLGELFVDARQLSFDIKTQENLHFALDILQPFLARGLWKRVLAQKRLHIIG